MAVPYATQSGLKISNDSDDGGGSSDDDPMLEGKPEKEEDDSKGWHVCILSDLFTSRSIEYRRRSKKSYVPRQEGEEEEKAEDIADDSDDHDNIRSDFSASDDDEGGLKGVGDINAFSYKPSCT